MHDDDIDHESDQLYVYIALAVGIVRAHNPEDAAVAAAFAATQDISQLLYVRASEALELAAPLRHELERLVVEHHFQPAIATRTPLGSPSQG